MAEIGQEKQAADLIEQQEDSLLEANETDVLDETETTQEEVAKDEEGGETTDGVNNTIESENIEHDEQDEHETLEESAIEQGNEDMDGDAGDIKDNDDDDDDDEEEEEEEEECEEEKARVTDPNVMPQVNVAVLAKRKWQVKVYPLKPADFTSGMISRVFKAARESLLYLTTGKYSLGKGEMYIASVTESIKVVRSLQTLDSHFQEINIEIVRKNGEGVVQEKAAMRFDTKMVRMLFVEAGGPSPFNKRYGPFFNSRKRERVIGSVFVKNLPPGTTKNMLRVMFPFAQEINYNPEKYTEGTARLVMKTRSTVIPCLKAFAKIELGGNILELHPLEKKPRPPPRRRSTSPVKEKDSSKVDDSGDKSSSESKANEEGKKEQSRPKDPKPADKSEEKDSPKKKEPSVKKEVNSKSPSASKDKDKSNQQKGPARRRQRRKEDAKKPLPSREKFQRNKDFGDRSFNKAGTAANRFSGGRSMGGGQRSQNVRNNNRSFGTTRNRGFTDRRMSGGPNASSDLAAKAEATKDMMVLQGQLNMAIKSQLAMLNQTQMAVEQAKRGAAGIGLGTNLSFGGTSGVLGGSGLSQLTDQSRRERAADSYTARSKSRDRANFNDTGNWGNKRSAVQANLVDDYDNVGFGRKRNQGAKAGGNLFGQNRGQQGRAAQNRNAQNRNTQNKAAQNRAVQNRAAQNRVTQNRAVENQNRAAQNRAAQNRAAQTRVAQSRVLSTGYDNDVYRQESYNLQDRMDEAYGYGGTDRSYAAGLGLGTSGRSTTYSDTAYGYRY